VRPFTIAGTSICLSALFMQRLSFLAYPKIGEIQNFGYSALFWQGSPDFAFEARDSGTSVFTLCAHRCILIVITIEAKTMSTTVQESSQLRTENINLRVTSSQKALIDRAAEAQGRNRSDFMLDAACREAESVLLDQRYFNLDGEAFQRFLDMLDAPPADNPGLTRLLKTKAPWDK